METLPTLPGCGRTAVARFELYSPLNGMLHGSLDGSIYLCTDHARARDLADATGLTPFRVSIAADGPKRCGDGFDFLAMRSLVAPGVAS